MRADSLPPRWARLLLAAALLTTGCASLTPPPGRTRNLSYTPRVDAEPALAERPSDERPPALASPPPSTPNPEAPQRLHRRRELRAEATGADPGSMAGAMGGALSRGAAEPARQSATRTRQAVLEAVNDVRGSTGDIAGLLHKLAGSQAGLGRANGAFNRYLLHGSHQLQWIHGALGGATALADVASEVDEPDMELALLRISGPRLQAAMSGALLLSAWLDFLNLADIVLRQCPFYGAERLFAGMSRVQHLLEPSLRALSSLEPGQVEATATALPELMGQLTQEFQSLREAVRVATERGGQLMLAAQLVELLTLASAMRLSLPRLPPASPATLGVGLVMGADGVMMGSRIVVPAEWVERMRRLVQAGVLSVPVVSAAVRIHAGQVMMAQAHQDLPRGVRDALGDGPEVRAMRETGKAGAGMAERPQHHVMPREDREWFEQRGFTGDMSIDQFCVEMEVAHHQALHGGGHWSLGRKWPGEWNQLIMKALRDAETEVGRMLTRSEVLKIVAFHMKRYTLPMNFTSWRGR